MTSSSPSFDPFLFLDQDEQKIVHDFALYYKDLDTFDTPSEPKLHFFELVKRLYQAHQHTPIGSDFRGILLAKLLNIAGVYSLLNPIEILNFLNKKPLEKTDSYHHASFPPCSTLIFPVMKEGEIKVQEIFSHPVWASLLKLPSKDLNPYSDRLNLFCKNLVLVNDMNQKVIASNYLSSTSEPISQSIVLNLVDDKGAKRDICSLSIDLVYQSIFLKAFYQSHLEAYRPKVIMNIALQQTTQYSKQIQQEIKQNPKLAHCLRQLEEISEN